jgi:hypothetical protein
VLPFNLKKVTSFSPFLSNKPGTGYLRPLIINLIDVFHKWILGSNLETRE